MSFHRPAWHVLTFSRICKRVENRFLWQTQCFGVVVQRWIAFFVAGKALWRLPSSLCLAGATFGEDPSCLECYFASQVPYFEYFIFYILHSGAFQLPVGPSVDSLCHPWLNIPTTTTTSTTYTTSTIKTTKTSTTTTTSSTTITSATTTTTTPTYHYHCHYHNFHYHYYHLPLPLPLPRPISLPLPLPLPLPALTMQCAKGHHHSGRHMTGDTWRETRRRQDRRGGHQNSGRQMKGDKAQTRPERRTPPLRETNEGRQGTDKTGEADTATQGNTWWETRHRQDRRGGHHH